MAFLNFGGPGWFNDVFEIEIEVDTTQRVKSQSLLFEEECPVYTTKDMVTGKVKVTAPENRTVWHYGVGMKLERTTSFYDSMRTVDEELQDIQLADGEYVTGTKEYTFQIDLSKIGIHCDSYDGEMFSVRHGLSVNLSRPWYTFDVMRHQSLVLHAIEPAPADGKPPPPSEDDAVSKESLISIPDCGGSATFAYGKSCYNLGETLEGVIDLKGIDKAIQSVKVVFYKIEKGDNEANESVIRECEVLKPTHDDEIPPPLPEKPAEGEDESNPPAPLPKPTAMAAGDKNFNVQCLIDKSEEVNASPTYVDVGPEDDTISVNYYIRLLIADTEGNTYWNTHEVLLYRSSLSNLTVVDV